MQLTSAVVLSGALLFSLATHRHAYADSYVFNFDTLPSAEGAVYNGTASESGAATINNGQLVIDTTGQSGDKSARYVVANAFDGDRDATLTWTVRVESQASSAVAAQMIITSLGGVSYDFVMRSNSIAMHNGTNFVDIVSSLDTSLFHTYELRIYRLTTRFDLFIDGRWRASGNGVSYGGVPRLLFGDSTVSGGNCRMRFKRVELVNWGYANQ